MWLKYEQGKQHEKNGLKSNCQIITRKKGFAKPVNSRDAETQRRKEESPRQGIETNLLM